MGSCISNHNLYELPNQFEQIPVDKNGKKVKCKLCMKYVKFNMVKCNQCHQTIGHKHCFRIWYAYNDSCPHCNPPSIN